MTYIKTTLPDIDTLKAQYKKNPKALVNSYRKYDIIQGPEESVSFITEIISVCQMSKYLYF